MSKITIKVPFYIENCGDGSAAIRVCSSLRAAKSLDKLAQEDEGWGESSYDEIVIKVDTETLETTIVEYKSEFLLANKGIINEC